MISFPLQLLLYPPLHSEDRQDLTAFLLKFFLPVYCRSLSLSVCSLILSRGKYLVDGTQAPLSTRVP